MSSARDILMVMAVMMVAGAGMAWAEDEDTPPCLADVRRLCGLVPPTGNFEQGCLQQHQSELSADCLKHVDTYTTEKETLGSACGSDTRRYCENIPTTAGGQQSCLVEHRESLSEKCRQELQKQSKRAETN